MAATIREDIVSAFKVSVSVLRDTTASYEDHVAAWKTLFSVGTELKERFTLAELGTNEQELQTLKKRTRFACRRAMHEYVKSVSLQTVNKLFV